MRKVTLMPGDGIGPEIIESVKTIFSAAKVPIEWVTVEIGIDCFHKTGVLIPPVVNQSLAHTRVGLKGPTTTPIGGGHRSINVTLRQEFDLYANVRPICTLPGLKCHHENIDMIIVRENSEDLYKGVEYKIGKDTAHGIKIITRSASQRIGTYTFEMARKLGRKKVVVVHKANIMKHTDGLFLESIREVAQNYPDIECTDMIVDNCAMQMVKNPEQFDIILTENLYGDILSDLGSGLIGGLGVASGANISDSTAIFEAVHGSAPDIAGKNLANPTALILSSLAMLDHLQLSSYAKSIKEALFKTLSSPDKRTRDLGGPLGTTEFTMAIISQLH